MAGEPRIVTIVAQIVAEAWSDPQFKSQLLANPAEIMRQRGLEVPADVQVVIHENTAGTRHIVLPQRPPDWDEGDNVTSLLVRGTVQFHLFLPGQGGGGRKRGAGKRGGGKRGGGKRGGRKRPR